MALTRNFKDTIRARAQTDSKFRVALLTEAMETILSGDIDTGKAVIRDYINATVGFEAVGNHVNKSSKSVMRMFSPSGNPRSDNLFQIIAYLQEKEGVSFSVKARR